MVKDGRGGGLVGRVGQTVHYCLTAIVSRLQVKDLPVEQGLTRLQVTLVGGQVEGIVSGVVLQTDVDVQVKENLHRLVLVELCS